LFIYLYFSVKSPFVKPLDTCYYFIYSYLLTNKTRPIAIKVIWRYFIFIMLTIEQQIFEQIKKAGRILIAIADTRDGDAVASAAALFLMLKKMDKPTDVAAADTSDKSFSFLPGTAGIKNSLNGSKQFVISVGLHDTKIDNIKYRVEDKILKFIVTPSAGQISDRDITFNTDIPKYDLIITLNISELEALGKIYEIGPDLFYNTPIINLDHSPENEDFGQINVVNLTAVATTEILFNLMAQFDRNLIDENIATCLLAGIIFATKSYKIENITPTSLLTSSELITMGARREEIVNHLYRSRPLKVLKLWGRVLARLSDGLDRKLVWAALSDADFQRTETSARDLDEIIDELIINIPNARVVVIIYETKDKNAEAIIFCPKSLDAVELTKEWQPTGHKKMALIKINKPLMDAEKEIIEKLKAKMEKLPL
jgi:nanoRNase/pAp phosphatase (c-di-AMP/oligoRNAs hydrolase)